MSRRVGTSGRWAREGSARAFLALGFAVVLAVANLHLFGVPIEPWTYLPDRVREGEWWRVVVHPFVHVSAYHLAIDAAGFLLVWHSLASRRGDRILVAVASGAGALFLARWLDPRLATIGLCGLSGAAHGLMAALGLEMSAAGRADGGLWCAGAAIFIAILVKTTWEVATGDVIFGGLHTGSVGTPIVWSHAGGILGGAMAWLAARVLDARRRQSASSSLPETSKAVTPEMRNHLSRDVSPEWMRTWERR